MRVPLAIIRLIASVKPAGFGLKSTTEIIKAQVHMVPLQPQDPLIEHYLHLTQKYSFYSLLFFFFWRSGTPQMKIKLL